MKMDVINILLLLFIAVGFIFLVVFIISLIISVRNFYLLKKSRSRKAKERRFRWGFEPECSGCPWRAKATRDYC